MEASDETVLVRDISAAREEFARCLHAAFPDATPTAGGWRVRWQDAHAEIELSPLPELAIALLRLPRQRCEIRLSNGSVAARLALLERLDRYQQRGGG